MFDYFCLFNSRLYTTLINDIGVFLVAYEYRNDFKHCFKESFRLKIPLQNFSKPKDILLDVTDSYIFGMKCIVILVINHSNIFYSFLYFNMLQNVIETQSFEYDTMVNISNYNLQLTNGPILLVFYNESFDMYFLPYKTKKSLSLRSIFLAEYFEILQFACIDQIYNNNLIDVVLLIVSGEVLCERELGIFLIFAYPESESNLEIHEKLCPTALFPNFLKKHVKAIQVSNLLIARQSVEQIKIDWTNNHTIVCTVNSCFVCIKGEIKYSIKTCLQDTILIKTQFPLSSHLFYIVLLSKQRNACLLKPKENTNILEVKKLYIDVECVLIGDILLNGSRNMILLKNSDFEKWQDFYSITDISNFLPLDILEQPAIPDDCLHATLSGLNAKFQIGKLAVAKRESEIREKTDATIHAIHQLQETEDNSFENRYESSFQNSLVDIILSKDENNKIEMKKRKDRSTLKVLNYWVKLISNKWVLCTNFLNEDERSICNPVIKVMVENQLIQCCQKLFLNSSDKFCLDDKCLKEIIPQERFSIVTAFDPLFFFTKNVKASVILSWFKGTPNEFENELFSLVEEKCLAQHQLHFQIDLKVTDIFSSKNQDISAVEDLFCMKVLQKETSFKISCFCSDLNNLEDIFSSEFCLQQLSSFTDSTNSRTFCFKNQASFLHGVHFTFICNEDIASEIRVFIRDDKQLLALMQFLYKCLPKDVVLIPHSQTAEIMAKMKQKIICSMKEETDLLVSSFNAHNISPVIKDFSNLPVQAGTIIIPKRTFKRIRKALVKKEYITDSILKNILGTQF